MAGNSLTSPLTLQMLMANGGLGAPQDPAISASIPRMQLAQSMMESGLSGTPTGPMGALGRLAQSIVGSMMFDKANTGIQDILTQRAQQAGMANDWIMGGQQNPAGTPAGATPVSAQVPSAPGGFAAQLASAEGKPTSVNNQGFSGQFQFGADRLASTGLYNPAPGENLKANEWKGSFNIPGFPNVKTQADFLSNPAAQNAALGLDIQNTDKVIANTPGAGALDQNGLRAVAHLGGVEGMRKFVESNGQYNPADANGTHLSDYYQRFSGGAQQGTPSVSAPAPGVAPAGPNPWEVIRRAGSILTNPAFQYNQQAQQAAQHAMEVAKLQIQTGSWSTGPGGIQTNAYTGEQHSAATPTEHYVAGPGGVQTETNTGKQINAAEPLKHYIPTPTGAVEEHGLGPPQFARPDLATSLTLSMLGSKDPASLTPQEKILLDVANESYRQYKTGIDPSTGGLIRYPERPPLPGMGQGAPIAPTPVTPPPGAPLQPGGPPVSRGPDGMPTGQFPGGVATGPGYPPGTPLATPTPNPAAPSISPAGPLPGPRVNQVPPATVPPQVTPSMPPPQSDVTPLTGGARGPQAAQKITEEQAGNDAKLISEEQASVMKGHSALGATAAIRATLPQVMTGPSADGRLLLSRYGTLLGIPDNDLKSMIGTNPVSGELLQKKLFEIQTHALRLMGAREPGSVLQAYQKNFPNMASQPGTVDAMTRMLDMDQIYAEDEIRGRQQHLSQQVQGIAQNQPYGGMGGYQQPDPRTYVAAALASGGRPFNEWAHSLTPQQQADALRIAARVYPDATALDAKGVRHQFQAPQQGDGGG